MSAGSNTKLTDDQRQKHFAYHFRTELSAEIDRRNATAAKSANRKLAKAADPTFTGQKFDHYLKAHFGEDDQKPVDKLRSEAENLRWLGLLPSATDDSLFGQPDRVDHEQILRAKAYTAGLLNLDRVSGYDGGSADDKLWLESYDAGKSEYETDLPDIMAIIEAKMAKEAPVASGDEPFGD